MEEVQPLPEYLRLVIHFNSEALTGVQTAEAPHQLLLDSVRVEEPYHGGRWMLHARFSKTGLAT